MRDTEKGLILKEERLKTGANSRIAINGNYQAIFYNENPAAGWNLKKH